MFISFFCEREVFLVDEWKSAVKIFQSLETTIRIDLDRLRYIQPFSCVKFV